MKLSIVIPAYNEETRISRTLGITIAYLNSQEYDSEIIVVCDGNTDETHLVASGFITNGNVSLHVQRYLENKGKGHAVQYGMLRAAGQYIMFMDADYAVPIEQLERGLKLLYQGADVAIGSRTHANSKILVRQNTARQLSAKIYILIQNLYLGINIKDTQCGFKFFTRDAAKKLFTRQKLNSFIFDPEILWLAKKLGLTVTEFPVTWSHVEGSQILFNNFGKSFFVFKELFRIKRLHTEQ
jgi:glycosyltransferase involved in cell wall biosynthesis